MFAVVFPGQGSQKPGMGQELFQEFAESRFVFEQVSASIGVDVADLCFYRSEDELRATQNAQIALYTCGLAAWEALRGQVDRPAAFAGHSVGEYAAVVASGALSLADGAKLVWKRGELMKNAPTGTMAAVLGLNAEALEAVCREAGGTVVVANDNCPGQLVISGDPASVARASELAQAAGAKRVLPLNVSGAFHSPLMVDAAREMGLALAATTWQPQDVPVYANVSASRVSDQGEWAGLLERQLSSSVRWTESVQAMIAAGISTFAECGSGEVLTGLLRRIDKETSGFAVTDPATLASAQQQLSGIKA